MMILTRLRCIWIKSWLCAFTASGRSSSSSKVTAQNSSKLWRSQYHPNQQNFYISSWSYQRQCSSSSKTLTKTRQNTNTPRWSLLNIRSTVQILNNPVATLKKKHHKVNIIHKWWTERLTLKREKECTLWIWMEFRKGGIAQPWYFISKSPFDFQWREISHNPDILPAQVFRQRGVRKASG